MVEKYGAAGRDLYMKIELTVSPMQQMNAVPAGALLFDLLENVSIVSMRSM